MTRIQFNDLPPFETLTPEAMEEIFGAGLRSFQPTIEALEAREMMDAGLGQALVAPLPRGGVAPCHGNVHFLASDPQAARHLAVGQHISLQQDHGRTVEEEAPLVCETAANVLKNDILVAKGWSMGDKKYTLIGNKILVEVKMTYWWEDGDGFAHDSHSKFNMWFQSDKVFGASSFFKLTDTSSDDSSSEVFNARIRERFKNGLEIAGLYDASKAADQVKKLVTDSATKLISGSKVSFHEQGFGGIDGGLCVHLNIDWTDRGFNWHAEIKIEYRYNGDKYHLDYVRAYSVKGALPLALESCLKPGIDLSKLPANEPSEPRSDRPERRGDNGQTSYRPAERIDAYFAAHAKKTDGASQTGNPLKSDWM
jgi:hypothetical protein